MGNFLKRTLFKSSGVTGPTRRYVVPNHLVPEDTPSKLHPNKKYANNYIKTTKYTILSFLPKNIFEQFHRFANLYFLFIVLLNWVPMVNAIAKELAMIPVIFVLAVTGIKDAFEDYRRYRSDKRINHQQCRVFSRKEKRYTRQEWADIHVGDIIHLSCDEVIPADVIILRSSDNQGICHIDTSNLDGESNLKQRETVKDLNQGDEFKPTMFTHNIECELPNLEIYKFQGTIVTQLGEKISVGRNNILLRGCIIRNTDFVEGIVVYAGHETKALLNNRGPRYKRSRLERMINRDVIWCVIILFFMCFFCSLGTAMFVDKFDDLRDIPYMPFTSELDESPAYQGFLKFWTFIILFQVMIPLSLYVTIELVKIGQVYFIHNDVHLYHAETDKRVECRALNITEDLGQVEYVFSDKTGTLTENKMVFKRCTIGGIDYSRAQDEFEEELKDQSRESAYSQDATLNDTFYHDPTVQVALSTMTLESATGSGDVAITREVQRVQEFFLLMAVCNTVVVSKYGHHDKMDSSGVVHDSSFDHSQSTSAGTTPMATTPSLDHYSRLQDDSQNTSNSNSSSRMPKIKMPNFLTSHGSFSKNGSPLHNEDSPSGSNASSLATTTDGANTSMLSENSLQNKYEAESPDELALVKAACSYGCRLMGRSANHVIVWMPGEGKVKMRILHVLQFDSHRKRMSVIVEHPETGQIILYCKGADSAILPNLRPRTDDEDDEKLWRNTQDHLMKYAKQGLRTLCMAKRILTSEEYKSWLRNHETAENALEHRERLIYESACDIETKLVLLGATGIEDRLQDGVPETIATLRKAGIKVWVLTGDKQETALNIAYSCQLISFEQDTIVLNARTKEMARDLIHEHLKMLEENREIPRPESDCAEVPSTVYRSSVSNPNVTMASSDPYPEGGRSREIALVIDGRTLAYALNQNLEEDFLKLAQYCNSVLCCRATPIQKGLVVKLVRDKLKKLTLAIGDGANDVSMIQTADVGVGISGQEGMQAVMSSDFALARFRFLKRLLLLHGHWAYDRLSRMTLYMFYKNAVYIFVLMWYQIFCGFSGGVPIDDLNLIAFNLVFTSLPPIMMGVFDQCVPEHVLIKSPKLYMRGSQGKVYKEYSYFISIGDAIWQSLVEFFIPFFMYWGSDVGYWEFGVTANAGCVYVTLVHFCLETRYWHPFTIISVVVSFILFIACNFIIGVMNHRVITFPYQVTQHTLASPDHWLGVILIVLISLLPRYIIRAVRGSLFPPSCEKAAQAEARSKSRSKANDIQFLATWSSRQSSASVIFQGHRRLSEDTNSPRKRLNKERSPKHKVEADTVSLEQLDPKQPPEDTTGLNNPDIMVVRL